LANCQAVGWISQGLFLFEPSFLSACLFLTAFSCIQVTSEDIWSVVGGELGFVQFPASDKKPAMCGPGTAVHLKNVWLQYLDKLDNQYIQKQALPNIMMAYPPLFIPPTIMNWARNDLTLIIRTCFMPPPQIRAISNMSEDIARQLEAFRLSPHFRTYVDKLRQMASANPNRPAVNGGVVPTTASQMPQQPARPHSMTPVNPAGQPPNVPAMPQNSQMGAGGPMGQQQQHLQPHQQLLQAQHPAATTSAASAMVPPAANAGGAINPPQASEKMFAIRNQIENWKQEIAARSKQRLSYVYEWYESDTWLFVIVAIAW
jgi:hypothetical protein